MIQTIQRMDETIASHSFDFVLGSLHASLTIYREFLQEKKYRNDYSIVERYFEDLTQAITTRRYDSLAHPDVVRMYGMIKKFEPQKHEATIRNFLKTALEYDQCLEVNTSGLIKQDYIICPDPLILDWASEIGNKFTLGSDSHKPESVGQKFNEVLPMLVDKKINKLHYYIARKRYTLDITI